ncbi:MAG TPA: hypothetical protein VLX32_03870 [Candidatus Acidoferrum sp.]|nr:hypothetical protein [Candidatus Acidoferrum sp.]
MGAAYSSGPGSNCSDDEIRSFVGDLESLRSGDLTVSLLVGCGPRAIAPLRDYLLNGQPRSIFQPRQRAVEALAELGAKEVLVEYLSRKRIIPDFEIRFGEEAVENTAARALVQWPTDDVYALLCGLAEERMLAGVIETLGKFERLESANIFVRALGDDVCRPAAEEALRRIAERVKPVLLRAAQPPDAEQPEKPSERLRRRSVVRILSDLRLTSADWDALRPLLHDRERELAVLAAEIAVDSAPGSEKVAATRLLIQALERASWFSQLHIEDCLRRNYSAVREVIAAAITDRRQIVQGVPLADSVLRILEHVRSQAEKSGLVGSKCHGQ